MLTVRYPNFKATGTASTQMRRGLLSIKTDSWLFFVGLPVLVNSLEPFHHLLLINSPHMVFTVFLLFLLSCCPTQLPHIDSAVGFGNDNETESGHNRPLSTSHARARNVGSASSSTSNSSRLLCPARVSMKVQWSLRWGGQHSFPLA